MYKYVLGIISIPIVTGFLLISWGIFCEYNDTYRLNNILSAYFKISLPFKVNQEMIISRDKASPPGFIVLKLSSEELWYFMNQRMDNYEGWIPLASSVTLGWETHYDINPAKGVFVNKLKTKNKYDNMNIFADTDQNLLIFHDAWTSGF